MTGDTIQTESITSVEILAIATADQPTIPALSAPALHARVSSSSRTSPWTSIFRGTRSPAAVRSAREELHPELDHGAPVQAGRVPRQCRFGRGRTSGSSSSATAIAEVTSIDPRSLRRQPCSEWPRSRLRRRQPIDQRWWTISSAPILPSSPRSWNGRGKAGSPPILWPPTRCQRCRQSTGAVPWQLQTAQTSRPHLIECLLH